MNLSEAVGSGNLLIALPIAALAGLVSFLSPCVLPLVPGYFGYLGGLTDSDDRRGRRRLVLGVLLFVLGFALMFTLFNAAFGTLGFYLIRYADIITRVLGVVVIGLGLVFMGRFRFAQRTVKPRWQPVTGLAGAPLLGIVFAIGWTPCVGPVLSVINLLSLTSGSAWQGALLGFVYALGLGIPFLLLAIGVGWAAGSVAFVRRHIRVVNLIGGLLLVAIGVLMVSGVWTALLYDVQAIMESYVPLL